MSVEIKDGQIIARLGKRVALLPFVSEGEVTIVNLDDVGAWHVPLGEEISLADLARLTALIEKAFDGLGQAIEFE